MTIRLLGTGAADGIPALYSNSEVSRYAREHGGKDLRTRSAALVDGILKIDFPPDTHAQLLRDKLDALDWSAILFTHSHADHFAVEELQYALYPFNPYEYAGFAIFGNAEICSRIRQQYPDWPFEIHETKSFVPFTHAEYTITPIHAYHKLDEDAHNLIIHDGKKALLYGTDTGIWQEETWQFLKDFKLDGLVIECTDGFCGSDYDGHLDIRECIGVVERLREQGTVTDSTVIYSTHHGHNGGATHAHLEKSLIPAGIIPGHDGLEFTI
jgi:phosphoribosyl 1,2-cyclic phosphate phosphodiesterase